MRTLLEQAPPETSVAWQGLLDTLNEWFHQPDLDMVRAVLAVCASHKLAEEPVWLFLNGPSGCGKTSIGIQCATGYERHRRIGGLTKAALMSMSAKSRGQGVLKEMEILGGVLLFQDFSTYVSLKENDREQLDSQLRMLFDRRYTRDAGTGKGSEVILAPFHIIAATTNAIESFRQVQQELGPRFIQLRPTPGPDRKTRSRYTKKQRKNRYLIDSRIQTASRRVLDAVRTSPELPDEISDGVDALSELVTHGRQSVVRAHNQGEIMELGEKEENTRINDELQGLMRGDAALFGQTAVGEPQRALAYRVALDSMPRGRGLILRHLLNSPAPLERPELLRLSGLWQSHFSRILEELQALGLIFTNSSTPIHRIECSELTTSLINEFHDR